MGGKPPGALAMDQEQLTEQLIQMIENGEYRADGKFLSERRLMEKFDCGRFTVRSALSVLSRLGYIYQEHGKGTFVKDHRNLNSLYSITRSTQSINESGMVGSLRILEKRVVAASTKIADELSIRPGDEVLMLKIVRYANADPVNYTISWVPLLPYFDKLILQDFERYSITEILSNVYQVRPKHTVHSIQPVLLSKEVADILHTEEDVPFLLFESVTVGALKGMVFPIEYFKCYSDTRKSQYTYIQDHMIR